MIVQNDAFPNFQKSTLFQSYPLGSASVIYYFTEIIGASQEWLQMWTQAVMMAGMVTALFAFARKWPQYLLATAGAVMLLCGNMGFTELLVDTLLPLTAFCAVAFCVYYQQQLIQQMWLVVPHLLFLTATKNSGMLFVVLILGYVLMVGPRKDRLFRKKFAVTAVSPFLLWLLWNRHVAQVFADGNNTYHSMSLHHYQEILSEKSHADMWSVLRLYMSEWLTGSVRNWLLILTVVLMLLVWLRYREKAPPALGHIPVFVLVSYVAYMLGMLGMYIFSMPIGEAMYLAGYERYHKTILILTWSLMLIPILKGMEFSAGKKGLWTNILAGVSILALLNASLVPQFSYYQRQDLNGTERQTLDTLIRDYEIAPGQRYLLLRQQQNDAGYLYYLSQYLLDSWAVTIADPSVEEPDASEKDYVILLDDTPEGRQFLQELTGVENDDRVIHIN